MHASHKEGAFETATPTEDRDPSRVHWMELFFDLIFVALVAQLAHGLHEHASMSGLLIFIGLFASVWWSWVNLTFAVNVTSWRSARHLSVVMLLAMLPVGILAVAAPEATADRAWLFAVGNAALRVILLGIWMSGTRGSNAASWTRILLYNGATAVLWLVSAFLPAPWNFLLWGTVIIVEVALLITSHSAWGDRIMPRMNVEHLTERFGLLVVIALGETVLSGVAALSENWSAPSALVSVLSFLVVGVLAWTFFLYGPSAMEHGLTRLTAAHDFTAIRDVIGFLPFPIVAGITAVSGAIVNAIAHPDHPLPPASTLALAAGLAAFYVSNAAITLRFGRPWPLVLRWVLPALVLTVALGLISMTAPALVTMGCAAVGLVIIATIAEVNSRRAEHTRAR